ncbi:hypothetical protein M378DRAFT_18600 [Amanita muscaria Koide BX008]|uniref:Protein kinase domain-containing protein n=1 Tax=Amanita muscaria (strain Koide BX008) TaxID=946122 RepID=A0A0C2WF50_AMAMK|nr:hypothetical protein M378DRAFT_18600 [Amanita muscaria Koide BX008]
MASQARDTLRWMSPELMTGKESTSTKESDLYAYAMTCYEILSGDVPFKSVRYEANLMYSVAVEKQRPEHVESCDDGYLDDVFDVLDAHQHLCIVMGRSVLLWMGAAVLQSSYFDLRVLIRNSQIAVIAEDILRTGNWEEAPLVRAYGEDYLQPPPRVFERTGGTFSIKLWSEEVARLLVDPPADGRVGNGHFLIEAPSCEVLGPVLLESDMHPGPEIYASKPSLLTTPNVCFLPRTHTRSQSTSREPQSKVYIPTISRYLDALLAQHRWLEENERRACKM